VPSFELNFFQGYSNGPYYRVYSTMILQTSSAIIFIIKIKVRAYYSLWHFTTWYYRKQSKMLNTAVWNSK